MTTKTLSFPGDFLWGTATSSYQIEGAWLEGGKGMSIWDVFTHTPGKIFQGHTGDVACDHYHRFREDVALMAQLGVKVYRFSIAWSRIQPDGQGQPNAEGIQFYNDLIDECLAHGIQPWATLYHWDLPAALHLEQDGWLNPAIAGHFDRYAAICFEHFGDRVKHWATLNEPWVVAILGYGKGVFAPGRVSDSEPYLVGHHLLLAHAHAVHTYRSQFQAEQQGIIGISNNCDWREPASSLPGDVEAAQRALEFFLGWFADPIYHGDYPPSMRARLGLRLPVFSDADRKLLLGSSDYFGLNHYTTLFAAEAKPGEDLSLAANGNGGISADQDVRLFPDPSWKFTTMDWAVVPDGMRKLLHWIDKRYGHPPVYLTENGCSCEDLLVNGQVDDQDRIDYFEGYLQAGSQAIQEGVNLKGYFAWSFMDNFEWASGYDKRFGLVHVDHHTGKRTPKASFTWWQQFLQRGATFT